MIHFQVMIRSRRAPGHPVEMFFWRLCERTPNGMRRELVYNATADSDLPTVLWSLGVGRFRVEWRDRTTTRRAGRGVGGVPRRRVRAGPSDGAEAAAICPSATACRARDSPGGRAICARRRPPASCVEGARRAASSAPTMTLSVAAVGGAPLRRRRRVAGISSPRSPGRAAPRRDRDPAGGCARERSTRAARRGDAPPVCDPVERIGPSTASADCSITLTMVRVSRATGASADGQRSTSIRMCGASMPDARPPRKPATTSAPTIARC
jgi:hypothetical protein